MSSLPPRPSASEAARLKSAGTVHEAGATLNRVAKRDPALYPLAIVVMGAFAAAGYFMTQKRMDVDPAKSFMTGKATNPWEHDSKLDTHPSQVAAFKYRYRGTDGHMQDAPPAMGVADIRPIADAAAHKFRVVDQE